MMALTVSEVNDHVKRLLDNDTQLANCTVRGELSNYKIYGSGHHYFVLKDAESTLKCVMFKGQASKLRFTPRDGLAVLLTGRISVFPRDGVYQLYVNEMMADGVGDLAVAFEQLKLKLHAEGLFDPKYKKPLPRYPRKVALITSPTGAVVHDMLQIMKRRYPLCKVLVCPVRVQGAEAPGEIAEMLATVNTLRAADIIIVGRGGGSLEDLWAFNEEAVARAIFASQIPVVSAVGHEPDVTIADFVADVRASTPSHAAETVTPDSAELRMALKATGVRLGDATLRLVKTRRERLASLSDKRVLQSPVHYVQDRRLRLDVWRERLQAVMAGRLAEAKNRFARTAGKLDAMSPLSVLGRGYAIAQDGKGKALKSIKQVKAGDRVTVRLNDGRVDCDVHSIEEERL